MNSPVCVRATDIVCNSTLVYAINSHNGLIRSQVLCVVNDHILLSHVATEYNVVGVNITIDNEISGNLPLHS